MLDEPQAKVLHHVRFLLDVGLIAPPLVPTVFAPIQVISKRCRVRFRARSSSPSPRNSWRA
jgi:hypothetical protein